MGKVVRVGTAEAVGAVYIGRPSRWGNPFRSGRDGTREEVIAKYRDWLWDAIKRDDSLIDALVELDGQNLACFCAPLACHGDVLLRAIEWAKGEKERRA